MLFDTAAFLLALTNIVAFLLSAWGTLLVAWGGAKAARRVFWTEAEPWKGPQILRLEEISNTFGRRLVLGLNFFLAGETIRLLVDLSQDHLIRIGVIVLIRVVLGFAVGRETHLRVQEVRPTTAVRRARA